MYLEVSITSLIKDKILPATLRKTNKRKDSSMIVKFYSITNTKG